MIRLEGRSVGTKNTALWKLHENKQKSGLPTKLRVAILLRRTNATGRFIATVEVESQVDIVSTLLGLAGSTPKNDPVLFDPACVPTSDGFDLDNLGGCDLTALCEVLSGKVMSTTT